MTTIERNYEVNAVRLRLFLDILRQRCDPVRLDEVLAQARQRPAGHVLAELNHKEWLSYEDEQAVIDYLARELDAWEGVHLVGSESVSQALVYILPHNPLLRKTGQVLASLPSLIAFFLIAPRCRLLELSSGLYALEVRYGEIGRPNTVDLLFIKGLVAGVLDFIGVDASGSLLTRCALKREQYPEQLVQELPGVIWSSDETIIHIAAPETETRARSRRAREPSLARHRESANEFVRSVLMRSARLFQDRRELVTAVEYLNMANDELEKKIREGKKEIEVARSIQEGFFPKLIPDWEGVRFAAHTRALAGVSGDLYDFFDLSDGRRALLVADVCGHGVPAALISAIAKISFTNHRYSMPSDVFSSVNLDILSYVKMEGYLTAFYMIIDSGQHVVYSMAGMPAPVLLRGGSSEPEQLEGEGTLIGMFPDAADYFRNQTVELGAGDKLFIFTDGLSEATDDQGQFFGMRAMADAIAETTGLDANEAAEHVMKRHREFCIGSDPTDDITLVVLEYDARHSIFENYRAKAREHYASGDLAGAEEHLRRAIHIFPRHPESLYSLGKLLVANRRFDEAASLMRRLIELRPYHAGAFAVLARCHLGNARVVQAESDARRALALKTNHAGALDVLARTLTKMGRTQEAAQIKERLTRPGAEVHRPA